MGAPAPGNGGLETTSTFHATPPRTVLHAPTPTFTLVRRHNVYAAAMSTGGATMVSSWYADTSGLRAVESLFSHFPLCTCHKIRNGESPEDISRKDVCEWTTFRCPRPFRSRAHGFIFSGLKRRKCWKIFFGSTSCNHRAAQRVSREFQGYLGVCFLCVSLAFYF